MQTAVLEKVSFSFPVTILKQAEVAGEFHVVGYAATTDFDLQGDVIAEEALRSAADDLLKNTTVLLNHDQERPIGKVTKAQFDKNGLLIDALISQAEQEIIQKIKEGVLNKFSIRGQVLERERRFMPELNRAVNYITKLSLIEVSLVSIPANPEARAIGWYVSKALEEKDHKTQGTVSQGGNPMPGEEVIVEEITPKGGEPSAAPAPSPSLEKPSEVPKLDTAPAKPAEPAATPPVPAAPVPLAAPSQSPAEIQKNLHGQLKSELHQELAPMVAAEVKKQLDAALQALPPVRKGLIQQDPDVEQLKKTFEGLPPEKKLKVALALQQG